MNSILMLGDCIGERVNLEVVLGMGPANWLKSPVLTVKHLCVVCLTEKLQLRWTRTPRIYHLFGSSLGLLQVRGCREVAFGENNGLEFFRGMWLKMRKGKPSVVVVSDQTI